jgi:hypothetical protein
MWKPTSSTIEVKHSIQTISYSVSNMIRISDPLIYIVSNFANCEVVMFTGNLISACDLSIRRTTSSF